jgi:hypothetical protein
MASRWDDEYIGNSTRQLGHFKPVVLPKRNIRALTANFFVAGKVAEEGTIYCVDTSDARGLIASGQAEYA